ncbi:MAG: M3 family oligoendopeptidase [Acidobacteriota bacterium]
MNSKPDSTPVNAATAAEISATDRADGTRRYEVSGWDLRELLPDADEATVRERLDAIDAVIRELEAHRDQLRPDMDPKTLLGMLRSFESLRSLADRLGGYASLWFSANTQSSEAVAFRNRIRQELTDFHNRLLFFTLWWKGLSDEEAAALEPKGEENADFRRYLAEERRLKPYTLDEASEKLVNIKDANGIDAIVVLYSMLTNRMEFEMEIDGEARTLTEEEMRSQFFHPDPDLRARTYVTLFDRYEQESTVLAQIYANRVRDWHTEHVQLRGFRSPISVRNVNNDISDEAVETMLDVVRSNAPLFQNYFRLKAKWLGIEPARRYDIYAPLTTSARTIPYADGVASVLDTFRDFDEGFADLAEKLFQQNHVDSEIRKGKRGGAFCATITPELSPWVLINYTGRVRDVATLAHELGHAVHSMMADQHSVLTQHPPLPLAETASVFGEMLMTRRMLAREKNPVVRREILAAAVDDIYATVLRQTYFVRFELAAHEAIMANKSADRLFEIYEENLREQFGPDMEISPEMRYEWLSIPHLFNTPFYCYAYSFGQLLVLALYRRYQEQGDAFKPGYLRLLSYGGSRSPAEALAEMDIDITDPAFWQGGFDVVQGMIEELESMEI